MDVPAITDDDTHQQLLKVVEALALLDPPLESVHGQYLDAVARACETYEKITWPL